MVSDETIVLVSNRLRIFYGTRWSEEQGQALGHFFDARPEVNDHAFTAAIQRHLSSWETPDGATVPPGRFPPTPADLEAHLHTLEAEQRRAAQQEESRQRRQESNRPYQKALTSPAWREEFTKGDAIRAALVKRYHLDLRKPLHGQVLMRTLTQSMDDRSRVGRVGLGSVDECLAIAQEVVAKMKETYAPQA